jgi:hypothetical protein
MTFFRMPLFVWALYATAVIQILATPVLAHHAAAADHRALPRDRHLRPGAGRRPGAVPALLLVLQPPGGLHHDPPGLWRDLRDHHGTTPQAHLRLQGDRALLDWHRGDLASSSGATTSSCRASPSSPASIFSFLTFAVAIPTAIKVFNWVATLYGGLDRLQHADVVRADVPLDLHSSAASRACTSRCRARRAPPRHLLRGRALPLRDDGRLVVAFIGGLTTGGRRSRVASTTRRWAS